MNIASAEHKANPFPWYARLRAEAPVQQIDLPDRITAWLLTRYDDVVTVLKDERFSTDRLKYLTSEQIARLPWLRRLALRLFKPLSRNMVTVDEPDHSRLRALVQQAFTPRRVEQMRDRIQSLTDQLLEAVQARGRMDLIGDYARPLPTTIIAEMLGVPVQDRHRFQRWTAALLSAESSRWALLWAIPNALSFLRYIRKLVKARRAAPGDDLLSALLQAEEAGQKLSQGELVSMVVLLLIAGHETTANLIGNGMLALLQHPEQIQKLHDDPSLIRSAVEELLRYGSPVDIASKRCPSEDVTIAGVTIRRGALVLAAIGSANRDEKQFADPDKLDITREPNKHLSFGLGTHYCLGASLARMEGQIAINTLLRRVWPLRLGVPAEKLRWRPGVAVRGLEALPVTFGLPA